MICGRILARPLALCLVILLTLPVEAYASTNTSDAQQASSAGQQDNQEATRPPVIDPNASTPAATQSTPVPAPQTSQPAEQTSKPLGTAAAPDPRVDGVPASTPSGAAIAPAKQKRISRFSIRTALVVGAVVAVGVIAGVSLATSGRP